MIFEIINESEKINKEFEVNFKEALRNSDKAKAKEILHDWMLKQLNLDTFGKILKIEEFNRLQCNTKLKASAVR